MLDLKKIPVNFKLALFCFLILIAFLTVNPFVTLVSLSAVPFFFLLYRKGEFPILMVAVIYQWIAISLKVWYFDIRGIDFGLSHVHVFPENINIALTLSIVGLIVFILGIWLVIRNIHLPIASEEINYSKFYSIPRLFYLYLGFSVFVASLGSGFLSYGGLSQALFSLTQLKWCIYLLLLLVVSSSNNKQYHFILFLIITGEVLLGFASYFSSFKEILFFSFIGLLAIYKKLTLPKVLTMALFAFMVFRLGIIWTAVKSDYRMYLSGGERQQVVTVSTSDALEQFFDMATTLTEEEYQSAELQLISRISYIDYFSGAISYVPEKIQHENGRLWLNAIIHIFTPRIFFPDKEAIDDSKHLTKYTGMYVATGEMGASFSLGYMGDSYVDFGTFYFWVPIFFLGMLIGLIYKYFLINGFSHAWRLVLGAPLFYFAGTYEMASIKLFGLLITYFLAFYIINKYVVPFVNRFISVKGAQGNTLEQEYGI